MPRGRGHRENLLEQGGELNLVPYLDIMVNLVLFMLVTITSFLSFTILNASIPMLSTEPNQAIEQMKKEQLLLMVRVTSQGFFVDPSVQGGASPSRSVFPKKDGQYDFASLKNLAMTLKKRFPEESRVLLISESKVIYDDIVHTMDAVRGGENEGEQELFPDVTLSIL